MPLDFLEFSTFFGGYEGFLVGKGAKIREQAMRVVLEVGRG